MMETSMSKVREMVSSDTVIGQPITTPDGVTLVPVSRLSFGFTCGGSDFGKQVDGKNFAGGTASAAEAAHSSDAVALGDAGAMALVVGDAPVGSLADSWVSWAEANGVGDPGAARAVVSSGAPSADGSSVSFTIECSGQAYQATLDATSGECSFTVGGEA